jgi:hypothetical protein
LLGVTGCPAKSGCLTCTVSGVMADGGTTTATAAPNSTLNLQMSTSGPIKEVRVTLNSADGTSETLVYSGDKVSGINSSTVTSITDAGLYDVDGKAPSKGTVAVDFTNGKSVSYPLTVEPEGTAPGTGVK